MQGLLNYHLRPLVTFSRTNRNPKGCCAYMRADATAVTTTERIHLKYESMSRGQRRLADFVLQNGPEAAMMSSAELASAMQMSESSVVRFAQLLGYQGYPSMRQQLQSEVLSQFRSSERVAAMVHSQSPEGGPLATIVSETCHHLQQLLLNVSEDQVAEAVGRIIHAEKLIVFGEGAPASLTVLAEFWLSRLGCNVVRVNQTGRRLFDQIFQASACDLAMVFAFRSVNREAMAVLEHLNAQGGETILITDLVNSRMHPLATQVFLVQRGPMDAFRPLGAALALVDALILGVMLAKGDDAVEQLSRLDALRRRYDWL
jgi:DNA-binding MurR/RpiR family transcriptional regulator